jgi:hypothetical protein
MEVGARLPKFSSFLDLSDQRDNAKACKCKERLRAISDSSANSASTIITIKAKRLVINSEAGCS